MGVWTWVAGYAAFGFGVRIFQLGIMRRNLSESLWQHGLFMAVSGSFGYWIHGAHLRNTALLKQRLQFERARQDAEIEYKERRAKVSS